MTTTMLATDERVEKALAMFEVIRAWPHWGEIALGAQKEYDLSPAEFQARLPEYQRFLALVSAYPGIGMISEAVDQLWHSHILNTGRYDAFCEQVIGHKVHHLPCSSYSLFGVDPRAADSDCSDCSTCKLPTIPTTCYGQRTPGESLEETRESILGAGARFREAYMVVFGELPAIWERGTRAPLAEGIAI